MKREGGEQGEDSKENKRKIAPEREENYLDGTLVGHVLHPLRHDTRRSPDVDIRVAHQLLETGYVRLAEIASGRLVVHHHADVRRACHLPLRIFVVPADLRRRVPVNVALQDLRGAVLGLHGDRLVPELWSVCEIFIFTSRSDGSLCRIARFETIIDRIIATLHAEKNDCLRVKFQVYSFARPFFQRSVQRYAYRGRGVHKSRRRSISAKYAGKFCPLRSPIYRLASSLAFDKRYPRISLMPGYGYIRR